MAGRPKGSLNKRSVEFDRLYKRYSRQHKFCPVEFLFQVAANQLQDVDEDGNAIPVDLRVRSKAATDLLSYRFSKKTAHELDVATSGPVQLVFDMNNANQFDLPTEAAADSATLAH